MRRTVARFATVTAMSVTMLALLPAAAPANVRFHAASIQFANQAQLQEDGTVLMTVIYACVPRINFAGLPFLDVRVEQPPVFGESATIATCDDQKHKVTVDVEPGPFKEGSAFADARVFNGAEVVAEKQAEIQIK